MKVKPKLYLNMSPQTAEEGSLAFARNMKIDDDGNLVSDYGYKIIDIPDLSTPVRMLSTYNIVGHIVGLDNKIYLFTDNNVILEYDELKNEITKQIDDYWHYSGGEIDGCVNTNISGEKILTIGEYLSNGSSIPLKHINLNYYDVADESLYCQAPKVPIANLTLYDTYAKTIPNGTYVFFIRYKIRKDVYTNWYLCSNPIFSGTSDKINTLQGGLKYINLHKDSAKSFILDLDFVNPGINNNIINIYEGYQIGFIITHDEATDARIWKTFSMNKTRIYFDYECIEETNIDDLLETTYELYNVRNITAFKNKLYISNYIESNFNADLSALVNRINIDYSHTKQPGTDVSYKNVVFNGNNLIYDYTNGYYKCTSEYLTTQNIFNYNFTNFSKDNLVEKEDIIYFDAKWDANYDPDLLAIHNMVNNTEGKVIFGNDFSLSFNEGKIGVVGTDAGDGITMYTPTSTPHPWYDLGFSFIYGSGDPNSSEWSAGIKKAFHPFNKYTKVYKGSIGPGWPSMDSGFDDLTRTYVRNNVEQEISSKNRFIYGYCYIASGGNVYKINVGDFNKDTYVGDGNYYTYQDFNKAGDITDYYIRTKCKSVVYDIIRNNIVGLDDNGSTVLRLYNDSTETYDIVTVNSISIVFKSCEFKVESPESIGDNDTENYNERFHVTLKSYEYTTLCSFNINKTRITITDNVGEEVQASSLMPLSTYNAYIHFVDEHNIITNGIFKTQITTSGVNSNIDKLVLNYSVSDLSSVSTYKAFFISLVNVGDLIATCFNYRKYSNSDGSNYHIVHCLEVDAMLYNLNDKITIIDNSGTPITDQARYYTSGHSNPIIAFGNCGFIAWEATGSENYSNTKLYVSIPRDLNNQKDTRLFKATNYISLVNTAGTINVLNGFYNSYFCLVKKPSFDLAATCYVAGADVYSASRNSIIALSDFDYYIQQQDTATYFIISNFNLNYLSLTEDINDRIFSIGKASSGVKQVAKVLNSINLSFIYELTSMYKDFMNKTFRPLDTNYKVAFDNTIRVSYVLSDETFNNSIFKFGAEDYYNVPTDRGIVVNLFSIGNNIYVHTKRAFYKFDATQTITASDKDIQLQESEPFDVGINQIFDSEYGYGGIFNKQAGCITFDSYFFYDQESNHIFAYGGNGQVQLIDASIYKLLNYYKPKYCRTLHDDANHRVLFEFTSSKTEGIFTLSFNYKSKSFVSFHDISLDKAFLSRNASYSYRGAFTKLFDTSNSINQTKLDEELNIYSLYGVASAVCIVQFGAASRNVQDSPFIASIIGFPRENFREVIDYITYLGDVVQNAVNPQSEEGEVWDVIKLPQVTRNNPVKSLYIITDTCVSTVVNETADDTIRPENLIPEINKVLNYKGFKYVKGFWNANYFRNAINTENIYNYPDQPRVDQIPNSDNYSLVYGRYFILNFAFISTSPIKFEELLINTQQY